MTANLEPVDDDACFACGSRNAEGLALRFERDGAGGARTTCRLDGKYQGYRGIAHGGIVMLLLDEAMAHAGGSAGEQVMTAAVSVRFRAPVPLETPLTLAGWVVRKRGKIVSLEAAISDAAGLTLATAQGSFLSLGPVAAGRRSNLAAPEPV